MNPRDTSKHHFAPLTIDLIQKLRQQIAARSGWRLQLNGKLRLERVNNIEVSVVVFILINNVSIVALKDRMKNVSIIMIMALLRLNEILETQCITLFCF